MGAPLKSDAGRTSFMQCEMFGLPCWCRVLRLFDVFSLQFVARETWSDSSDFPDWTLSDINHDHSTMNLVALQKQWEQNRSDVSKAQTTWFDSLQYWHRLTLGRSYLYAGNQLAPWQWRVYRNLTSKCKGGALSLDENWDVIFKSPVVSCRTFAMWYSCRWLGILLYHWCFDWKEATDISEIFLGVHRRYMTPLKNNLPSIGRVWIPVACCNLYIYVIYFFFKKWFCGSFLVVIFLWASVGGQKGMINQLQVEACLIYIQN